ncbi:Meprin A subunit beta [Anabarilius grahami]|uniref:Meprin A subunit beta n=1 Tax=Anabarilius grahami TaxID=495550 RepID=A0A3N0YZ62_ANAGA|nr:Meprin A subunit beta [Anabarilius grahami]
MNKSVCSAADEGWRSLKSVSGVNVTDHTYLSREQNGSSSFMHFSTEGRNQEDAARLESRTLTPTRDCRVQCLQFYYYHSGNESDQLNIWIREFQNESDSRGSLRLMDQITGLSLHMVTQACISVLLTASSLAETPGNYWKLHHVPLNANTSFQVVFEGRKGAGNSRGGFSLDDINVSETECPHIWQIRDFEKELNMGLGSWSSPLYYSSDGYRFEAFLVLSGNQLSMFVALVSGAYDDQLQWPCPWRQITVQILDQNPHIQKRMSFEQSITTDPNVTYEDGSYYWDNPRIVGFPGNISGETVFVSGAYFKLLTKDDLTRREFIKGGDIIFLLDFQDISALLQKDSLSCPKVTVKNFSTSADSSVHQEPCAVRTSSTAQPISTTGTTTTPAGPTERSSSTAQPISTTTTTPAEPTERECVDIFCSSSSRTASSLIILLLCFLLLEI